QFLGSGRIDADGQDCVLVGIKDFGGNLSSQFNPFFVRDLPQRKLWCQGSIFYFSHCTICSYGSSIPSRLSTTSLPLRNFSVAPQVRSSLSAFSYPKWIVVSK